MFLIETHLGSTSKQERNLDPAKTKAIHVIKPPKTCELISMG